MQGLEIRDTPMNFTAVRIHYTADPAKHPGNPDPVLAEQAKKWLAAQRALYPDPNVWEQEMEINFFVGSGKRVFPQFNSVSHTKSLDFNRRRVVRRGWDFGWHAPVCLFSQIDDKDRLCVIKEVVGNQLSTSDFAKAVIQKTAEWLPNHAAGFEDYVDPAGQHVLSIESEKNERRDVEVLEGLGIHATWAFGWSRKDGRSLVHQLLNLRSDSTPSMYVDMLGCPTLAQAFLGSYVYKTKQDGTVKDEPNDDEHPTGDVMAALRYLVIGCHRYLGVARYELGKAQNFIDTNTEFHGYGSPRRR